MRIAGFISLLTLTVHSICAAAPVVPAFDLLLQNDAVPAHRAGLLLLGELGCTNCHDKGMDAIIVKRPGPDLRALAGTLRPGWIAGYLEQPYKIAPGTTMPHTIRWLDGQNQRGAAMDIEAFLRESAPSPVEPPEQAGAEEAERGRLLYHSIGCVACHEPFDDAQASVEGEDPLFAPATVPTIEPESPSIPLPQTAMKYTLAGLTDFLLSPHEHRPAGRMPSLSLDEIEARSLAVYLAKATQNAAQASLSIPVAPLPDIQRGRRLFQESGCAACHTVSDNSGEPIRSALNAPLMQDLQIESDDGCLSVTPRRNAARYDLTDAQRSAIREALAHLATASTPTPAERLDARLAALNCYACHSRNGLGGPEPGRNVYFRSVDDVDLGDEGRLPPPLDDVGAKLTEAWLTEVLHGHEGVRPYMATRMPDYGATHGDALVKAILETDTANLAPEVDTGLEHHHRNRYGRELLGVNGLGCITCHYVNGQSSIGVPSTDLALAPDRLRPAWFKQYLLNPAGYRPLTRMPQFFPDGKSTYPALFEGDPVKQAEAIWTYLKEADVSRLPEGIEPEGHFELEPTEHPVVHRTFLTDAGTHAIAVGYPEGVHAGFDARNTRLALIWRGGFLSAESAWADRFTPFVSPLGAAVQVLPDGPAWAALDKPVASWPRESTAQFTGYQLDASRQPTFLYSIAGVDIEEHLQPLADASGFTRHLRVAASAIPLYLRLALSVQISKEDGGHTTAEGLHISVPDTALYLRDAGEARELLLKVAPHENPIDLTIEMTW